MPYSITVQGTFSIVLFRVYRGGWSGVNNLGTILQRLLIKLLIVKHYYYLLPIDSIEANLFVTFEGPLRGRGNGAYTNKI